MDILPCQLTACPNLLPRVESEWWNSSEGWWCKLMLSLLQLIDIFEQLHLCSTLVAGDLHPVIPRSTYYTLDTSGNPIM